MGFCSYLCSHSSTTGLQLVKSQPDPGLIPGSGRSPGEGKGYPLQYSGLENPMDCVVLGVAKSRTQLSNFQFQLNNKKMWVNAVYRRASDGVNVDATWNYRGEDVLDVNIRDSCFWSHIESSIELCFFPSIQSIDDLNKWALFLVSPFILEAEHIAFVTESIWVQGENLQRPASSSETVSTVFVICQPLSKLNLLFYMSALSWLAWFAFFLDILGWKWKC